MSEMVERVATAIKDEADSGNPILGLPHERAVEMAEAAIKAMRETTADVEITPEMVDAGVAVVREWEDSPDYSYKNLVERVFRQMLAAAPKVTKVTPEMIKAGVSVLCGYDNFYDGDAFWAEKIYRAMEAAKV